LTLDSLRASQKPLLLLFLDAQCGPCNALLPEIARWQQKYAARLSVVAITRGKAELVQSAKHDLQNVLLQKDFEVAQAYQVQGTPSAVLVRADGTIGSPLAGGEDAIRALLASTVGAGQAVLPLANKKYPTSTQESYDCSCGKNGANGNGTHAIVSSKRGEFAPAFQLPDLNGEPVDLAAFKGKPTLILFWNPGCGFCRQMLEELREWERNRPADMLNVLLVSTGTIEANRALNLQAPVLLDSGFSVAMSFGARGTPSAVLVDAEGRIAADVAGGRDALWALAREAETGKLASTAQTTE
jgi:thiol-disulfide isomerase/thioredoxin